MKQSINNSENVKVYFDRQSMPVASNSSKVMRVFVQRGNMEPYKITIVPQGGFFELKGVVDSEWTRDIVLSMVPVDGLQYKIIDKMTITPTILN